MPKTRYDFDVISQPAMPPPPPAGTAPAGSAQGMVKPIDSGDNAQRGDQR